MKIEKPSVLILTLAPRAGTPQYCHNLASHLVRNGHRVTLAAGVGYELKDYAKNYKVLEVFDRFRPRPILFFAFLKHLLSDPPDVIHFQGGQSPGALLLMWIMLRIVTRARFVYTPQELGSNNANRFQPSALRVLVKSMDHIFFNSKENYNYAIDIMSLSCKSSSVIIVPDLLAFLREDVVAEYTETFNEDSKVILCLGLIEPRKGIPTLIRAFKELKDEVPEAVLVIVGKPLMPLDDLYQLIEDFHIEHRCLINPEYVSFEKMAGYFKAASIVAMPYDSGWNSGLPAIVYGFDKPIVATRIGDSVETIEHGKTGYLVDPRDHKEMARYMTMLLRDENVIKSMIPYIRLAQERNPWHTVAELTGKVYQTICN